MFPGYENKSPVYDAPPAISENVHARRKAQKEEERRRKEAQKGEDAPRRYESKAGHSVEGDAKGRAAPRTEAGRPWKFTLVRRLVTARREATDARKILEDDEELWRVVR